ncbi:MAG: excinuclease ABC subunit UvrC [Rickettsia endosymbiont of Oxypoda opaca]|nr:excinuclease ABC subunit UvrC [Rickettsia endosymbiont of Oxypoda opaca]
MAPELKQLIGSRLIKSRLEDAPTSAGVYRMFDISKQIIYVGKAKNLKKRLTNYINTDLDTKTIRMVAATHFLEYSVTNSEVEALLLEAQLIKKFQPKFNILLKDDKSFPFIKLRLDHDYPQLLKFRGRNLTNGKFFGPFASPAHVITTLKELQKIFKLRSCTDNYFNTRKRPCLQYEIKRCYAPCVGKINKEDYAELVMQVKDFLQGRTKELQENLSSKMEELSRQMRFEEAAEIRDRIKALSYVQLKAGIFNAVKDADVITIIEKNGHYCVEVFLYRIGQACGNISYFPVHTENSSKEEVLEYFILQFYQKQQAPPEIILNCPIDNKENVIEAIKKFNNINKFNITIPVSGGKAKLVENAEANAALSLDQHLKRFAKNQAVITEIKDLFDLPELPERIEVYDNSHIMGKFAVGAMIVAGKSGFDKKEYRIFNVAVTEKDDVKGEARGDDFDMLRQVLTRRLTRLKQEPHKTPSLMIIDGGKGHLSIVKEVMNKLGINLPFVCMSKGPDRNAGLEQFHMVNREVFTIDKNQPLMKYLQILRDEAHNFAIKNHRLGRSRAIKISSLDQIDNIGEIRKKALLHYFGSYKAICEASIAELSKVKGISVPLAQIIFQALNKEK